MSLHLRHVPEHQQHSNKDADKVLNVFVSERHGYVQYVNATKDRSDQKHPLTCDVGPSAQLFWTSAKRRLKLRWGDSDSIERTSFYSSTET